MNNPYALYLDDIRKPNSMIFDDGIPWVVVRSYDQFVKIINGNGMPSFISFDHDISIEHYSESDYSKVKEKTGFHCAQFLIEYCEQHNLPLPNYQVHSLNPVGKENIISLLESYKKSKSII